MSGYNSIIADAIAHDDRSTFFNEMFKLTKKTVEFDPKWANGTGYFDRATKAELPALKIGEVGKCVADFGDDRDNRRILIVKTRFGNVVLFERYICGKDGKLNGPIVHNTPSAVRKSEMFHPDSGALTARNMSDALGDESLHYNVGRRIENFFSYLEDLKAEDDEKPEALVDEVVYHDGTDETTA